MTSMHGFRKKRAGKGAGSFGEGGERVTTVDGLLGQAGVLGIAKQKGRLAKRVEQERFPARNVEGPVDLDPIPAGESLRPDDAVSQVGRNI